MAKKTSSCDLQWWLRCWNNRRRRRRNLLHMVKNGGAFKHIHQWPRKLLHVIFNGGYGVGTIAEDDEEIFYIWSRTVVPLSTFTNGQGNFFIWSRMALPMIAHSPMAKETSSRDL